MVEWLWTHVKRVCTYDLCLFLDALSTDPFHLPLGRFSINPETTFIRALKIIQKVDALLAP
jgi:hypothetical protein